VLAKHNGSGKGKKSVQELSVSFKRYCSCRFCAFDTAREALTVQHILRLLRFVESLPNLHRITVYDQDLDSSPHLLYSFLSRIRELNTKRQVPIKVLLRTTGYSNVLMLQRHADVLEGCRIDLADKLSKDWPSFDLYHQLTIAEIPTNYLIKVTMDTASLLGKHLEYLHTEVKDPTIFLWFDLDIDWAEHPYLFLRFMWSIRKYPGLHVVTCPTFGWSSRPGLSVCSAGWGSYDINVFTGKLRPCSLDHETVGNLNEKLWAISMDLSVFDLARYTWSWAFRKFSKKIPVSTCRRHHQPYTVPFWRVIVALFLLLVRRKRK